MRPLSDSLKKHHLIQNRSLEIYAGIMLFVIGSILVYDAFNARGKELPWPFKLLAPW
jgi:hypothetical protein